MNKNYLKYAALTLLFMFINSSFAMGGKIFKAARFMGVTALPAYGLHKAYERNEVIQKGHEEVNFVTDESLQKWFKEQKEQINIPNANSILLIKNLPWGSFEDKKNGYVTLSGFDAFILNNALISQPEAEKEAKEYSKKLEDLYRAKANKRYVGSFLFPSSEDGFIKLYESLNDLENQSIDRYKSIIARDSMILKHELGHIAHKDSQHNTYALAAIPIGVEALSFGATKTFRKLFNIHQQPKTFLKKILRSCSAVGAIAPKFLIGIATNIYCHRYEEMRADKFACEHAGSRLELEEYAKFFKKHENPEWASESRDVVRMLEALRDPKHPASVDRKEMVESYLDKWDKEHAHEVEKRA